MGWVRSEARNGLRSCVLFLAAGSAALVITSNAADAWGGPSPRVHYVSHVHYAARIHRRAPAEEYSPPTASIVVDGNTGQVLEASNPDALRHPASLTKIMTLYLLFERLDAGKIKLDSPLKVSEHAAEQAPTKLGLKPGQTVTVEDAIKGIVTRSANDAAVTIAENLGGDEDEFAKLMTQKAHALGMSHTTYVNASGLPDDDQITSARDQALLGRAIQDRFPRFYKYFSTPSFVFRGETIRTHDHLLGSVEGVDGIKTGFTLASGFNLVTSVHRDGRSIVGVVLGGRSAAARDAQMRELIGEHIKEAAIHRTAPMVAEQAEHHDEPRPVETAQASAPRSDAAPIAMPSARVAAGNDDPIRPVLVKTTTYRIAPVPTAPLAPMPTLVPVTAPAAPPAASQPISQATASELIVPAQPASVPPVASPRPVVVASAEAIAPATTASTKAEPANAVPAKAEQARARGGWLIQIGAYGGEDEAKQHLSAAQLKVHAMLAAADPFTERVQKGDKAFYRARFAGFDKETAEATCRQLKHNDIECMALKD
jgi:D-alanyl-D-alanine carboxypeptidase